MSKFMEEQLLVSTLAEVSELQSHLATPPTSPGREFADGKLCRNVSPLLTWHPALATPPETPESSPLVVRRNTAPIVKHDNVIKPGCWCQSLKLEGLIGEGLWSRVYRASRELPDRPVSDGRKSQHDCRSKTFAVKIAHDDFSKKVLFNERTILAGLHLIAGSQQFTVPFHGWHNGLEGIVMEEIPLTLFDVMSMEGDRNCNRSDKTFPGTSLLMRDLVDGLHFLHEHLVIHGDVKPHNILMKPLISLQHVDATVRGANENQTRVWHPYYCDFSASTILEPGEDTARPHSVAGGSYDYMAPELFSLQEPECHPSIYSDVYALGVTLLSVILGCSPFDGIPSGIMRRAICKQGNVLEIAKERFRILRDHVNCLKGALEKRKDKRWRTLDWQETLLAEGWPQR
ncbi:MAG: hypothetical protein M1828_005691 [Chrysothrix sp. TS-e1954]|nr:MAG: hypothetical protein M1828_005691 [Chrysothrix sp. TS-e1954]